MVRSKWAVVCLCVILLSSFYIGYEKHTNANQSQIVATGTVTVNSLNVRQTPSTSGTRIGNLARGATVSIYETSANGSWLKIKLNNQWAYVHGDYVKVTPVSTSSNNSSGNQNSNNTTSSIIATGSVNVNSLNVRQAPSTSAARVGSLSRGANVSIYETGISGKWLKIKLNNQWAYVHGDYITVTKNNNQNSSNNTNNSNNNNNNNNQSNNSNSSHSMIATGTVNVNSLNVRQSASTSSPRVGSLARGATVSIYEQNINGSWLKIKLNNQWAYVHGDYLTVTNSSQNNNGSSTNNNNNNNNNSGNSSNSDTVIATGTVDVNLLNVRKTASTSGTRVGSLSRGATVSIYEQNVNGSWLKIKLNNEWAYIHGDYVTVTVSNNNPNSGSSSNGNNNSNSYSIVATGSVDVTTLNVRQTASTSGTRVGTLARGATVSIYETNINGNWLKIKLNNEWAYIHGDYVTVTVKNNNQNSSGSTNNSVPPNALANKTIVIDPGHGGSDPGAVANGLQEKNVVLRVSLALRDKLKAAGANVVMIRETDVFVPVNKRFEIANATTGHSFVSIHTNSLSNSSAHGTETFWNRVNQHAESQKLAQIAQKHLIKQLSTRDRGVKEGNFGVVRYTKLPSILVELGFITNPNDANMMKQDRFYEDAAEALLQALVEFHK